MFAITDHRRAFAAVWCGVRRQGHCIVLGHLVSCAWLARCAHLLLWSAADGQANGAQQIAETGAASPLSVGGAGVSRTVTVSVEELLPVGTRDELNVPRLAEARPLLQLCR